MAQRYSVYCIKQTKQIEYTILLILIKIVNTMLFANKANFVINKFSEYENKRSSKRKWLYATDVSR